MTQVLKNNGQALNSSQGVFQRPTPYIFTNTYSTIFDGVDDKIDVDSTSGDFDFAKTDPMSISVWVNLVALANTKTVDILAKYDAGAAGKNKGYSLQINRSDPNYFVDFRIGDGTNGIVKRTNVGEFGPSSWYHIVMTKPSTPNYTTFHDDTKIYLNGVDQTWSTFGTWPNNSIVAVNSLKMGYIIIQPFLYAYVDEPSIYNGELSTSQVEDIYNGGLPRDISTLSSYTSCVSWWRMGDDPLDISENKIKDQVNYPNGNDGTPTFAGWAGPGPGPGFVPNIPS